MWLEHLALGRPWSVPFQVLSSQRNSRFNDSSSGGPLGTKVSALEEAASSLSSLETELPALRFGHACLASQ
jgi:hypothetical protein